MSSQLLESLHIEGNRMDVLPLAGESVTTAITNHMVCLAREEGIKHICFLLALRVPETHLPKTFKDVTNLPADSKKRWLKSYSKELRLLKDRDVINHSFLISYFIILFLLIYFSIYSMGKYMSHHVTEGVMASHQRSHHMSCHTSFGWKCGIVGTQTIRNIYK